MEQIYSIFVLLITRVFNSLVVIAKKGAAVESRFPLLSPRVSRAFLFFNTSNPFVIKFLPGAELQHPFLLSKLPAPALPGFQNCYQICKKYYA